ncbi:MAG: hypothetical protein PHY47_00510 [Lachnospiraceae bacterium]|nr:hypothetical protein [Lachnospiraceae bacterium]
MAYQPISNSEILNGAPLDYNLLAKIKSNLEFHQSDLTTKADIINRTVAVGTVRTSILTLEQFAAESPGQWMLMNGQSCVGTRYQQITGNSNVPNASTEGTFLRQAKAGRALGSYEADENKSHNHPNSYFYFGNNPGGLSGAYASYGSGANTNATHAVYINSTNSGGNESRPKNVAVNFFIKVGY